MIISKIMVPSHGTYSVSSPDGTNALIRLTHTLEKSICSGPAQRRLDLTLNTSMSRCTVYRHRSFVAYSTFGTHTRSNASLRLLRSSANKRSNATNNAQPSCRSTPDFALLLVLLLTRSRLRALLWCYLCTMG